MDEKNNFYNAPENKPPEDKKYTIIAIVVIIAFALLLFSNCSCGGGKKCSVCHGSGYYQKKTCVFCDGTGYSDYDPYDHYKSAMGY